MKKSWKQQGLAVALTAGLLLSPVAPALAADELSFDLDQIVVTATKTEKKVKDVPAAVQVITKEDMEKRNIKTIDDALKCVSGIVIKRSKGLMDSTNKVTMRGFGSQNHVLVLLDGASMNDGYNQGVDWNQIPTDNIERIEVIKGPGSALYGSSAMGGVINIITKQKATRSAQIRYLTGGMGTTERAINYSDNKGKLGYFFSADKMNVDGYFSPETASKGKNGSGQETYDGKIIYTFDDKQQLTFRQFHSNYNYDYEKSTDKGKYQNDNQFLSYKNKFNDKSNLNINWSENKREVNYIYSGGLTTNPSTAKQLEAQMDFQINDKNYLTIGLVNKNEKGESKTKTDMIGGKAETNSFYIQNESKLNDAVTMFMGGRYDRWTYSDGYYKYTTKPQINYPEKTESKFNPKLGVVYKANDKLSIRGSFSNGFRAPNTSDMFKDWYATASKIHYKGNEDLNPEKSSSYEMGFDYQFNKKTVAKINFFNTNVEDLISKVTIGNEMVGTDKYDIQQPRNVGNAKIKGYELEFNKRFNDNISAFVNYAYTDSKMKEGPEAGNAIKYVPKKAFNVGMDYVKGAWKGSIIGNYVGDSPNSSGSIGKGYKYYEKHFLIDTKIAYSLDENSIISLSVDNLLDKKYYQFDLAPGRTTYLELTKKF